MNGRYEVPWGSKKGTLNFLLAEGSNSKRLQEDRGTLGLK